MPVAGLRKRAILRCGRLRCLSAHHAGCWRVRARTSALILRWYLGTGRQSGGEMHKPFITLLLPLLLTACGVVRSNQIANMDAQQVRTVSDSDLCRPWTSSSAAVMAERERRGLADCSAAHRQCKAMGYTSGTQLYLQCRTMLAQSEAAQDAATGQALIAASAQMAAPPPLPPPPRMVTCTSTGMGNMVTTNCQ